MVAKAAAEETKKSVPKSPHKKSMKTKDATVTMQKVGADGKVTPIKSEKISEEDSPSTRTHVAVKTAKGLQATISMPIAEGKRCTVSPSTTIVESEKFASGMKGKKGATPTKHKDDEEADDEKEEKVEKKKAPAKKKDEKA